MDSYLNLFIKEKNDTCQLTYLQPNYIQIGNCISKKILSREICAGSCDSRETNYIKIKNKIIPNKECKCCTAEKIFTENIQMICNNEVVDAEYIRIDSCKCKDCDENLQNFYIN